MAAENGGNDGCCKGPGGSRGAGCQSDVRARPTRRAGKRRRADTAPAAKSKRRPATGGTKGGWAGGARGSVAAAIGFDSKVTTRCSARPTRARARARSPGSGAFPACPAGLRRPRIPYGHRLGVPSPAPGAPAGTWACEWPGAGPRSLNKTKVPTAAAHTLLGGPLVVNDGGGGEQADAQPDGGCEGCRRSGRRAKGKLRKRGPPWVKAHLKIYHRPSWGHRLSLG